jgi:hypothetical protein
MASPEFLICLECETPCYDFEWHDDKLELILCNVCGNDDPDQFVTEDDFEALSGGH